MSSIIEWCFYKEVDWVEVIVMGEVYCMYMDLVCGGYCVEYVKRCFCCGDEILEENDVIGEGFVYWMIIGEDFCLMECVIWMYWKWLKVKELWSEFFVEEVFVVLKDCMQND